MWYNVIRVSIPAPGWRLGPLCPEGGGEPTVNPYELMFILDSSSVADDAVDGYIERFGSLIVENGGQVLGVDKWGRRRFAYEIKGRTEGYYVVMTFKASREVVAELTRVLGLTDGVVRHLVVRLEREPQVATEQPSPASENEAAAEQPEAQPAEAVQEAPAEAESADAESGEAVAAEAAETQN